ncbi:3-phosphoshikimate 1-carboxyvinyltransferase [Dactylosporangium sp. AC04546]|uniref:3-phosphoshikimate 1-carboxyvinyltransferase n=1 Tax=Dactylosporangium sp. AC04546 TaxID=2862460 RepID=UPI001EDCC4F1|nr:3-phosphoshikimate 1-carboxyvinyltransferase [Dactylosporangium sp. AC04546]WVK84881.1 3-phosphoshikimate 1-carboxyvinyltransferase [Dactylosporangium sp. AC04546]
MPYASAYIPWTAPTAAGPIRAVVRLPGSKSMTVRALVLATLSLGASTLRTPLRARDTELMAAGLRAMGSHVSTVDDNLWVVRPRPLKGPARVNVGLAGTVMRFLPPIAALADGTVRFDGEPRARKKALAPLVNALRTLGVHIDAEHDRLPLSVHGIGRVAGGHVTIDASASSQLVSGLLLAAAEFDRGVVVRHIGPPVRKPHLDLTVHMLRAAGAAVDDSRRDVWAVEPGRLNGRAWDIEPDLSGAAPFLAAALVTGGAVTIEGWPAATRQPGGHLLDLFEQMGGAAALTTGGLIMRGSGAVHGLVADVSRVTEATPVLAALAAVADSPSHLYGLRGSPERTAALAQALGELGADVTTEADGLRIRPRPLRGATFRTNDDHRLAHAGAVIGLAVSDVRLDDVACTAKTLPDFPRLWSTMVHGGNGGSGGAD